MRVVICNTLKQSFVIDCYNKRKHYHQHLAFSATLGHGDLFECDLERDFGFSRSLTDRPGRGPTPKGRLG